MLSDLFINILNMLKDILSNRFTCRWFVERPVKENDLEYILDCAYLAPSKGCFNDYKIIVLDENEKSKEIKDWLFYEHTYNSGAKRGDKTRGLVDYNGQYNAPVVLIYLVNRFYQSKRIDREWHNYRFITETPKKTMIEHACFMSAITAMIAAEELGYATGFGCCHSQEAVADYLGYQDYEAIVSLGIGQPKEPDYENRKFDIYLPVKKDGEIIGYCADNVPAEVQDHYDRQIKNKKDEVIHKFK